MKKFFALILAALLLTGTVCAGFYLLDFHKQERVQEKKITDLRRRAKLPTITDMALPSLPKGQEVIKRENLHDFAALQAENSQCVGWVTIPGTGVDFPVMQSKAEPEFYLKHDFDREYDIYGLPFLDARCGFDSGNLLIYGHHMNDGTMFSCLHKYTDADFLDAHREVIFETPAGAEHYQVREVLRVKGSYAEDEWSIFQCVDLDEKMHEELSNEIGFEVTQTDKLLTLVTCEYSQKNGRLAVIAVK